MRRLVVVAIALAGAFGSTTAAEAITPAAFMSCGFAPAGGSSGSIDYRQHPDHCYYSSDGSSNDLINLVDIEWEDWGQPIAHATGLRVDTHDQDRNGFQRHPVEITVQELRPAVGDAGKRRLYYSKLVVVFEDGESYDWPLHRPSVKRRAPETRRTCGLFPDGVGAYSYIQTRGIRCAPAYRIAFRARKRFCKRHNDCEIDPFVSIGQTYKGKTATADGAAG
ncbi:MAG TPA: hypothetical protein VFU11_04945 [Solirubrobacterales bacterium]|nr:hypothetical protein [Solirubrobacterales bacterium]